MTAGSITGSVRRFWRLAWDANLTGMSAMLAYNMLLGIIPVALLGLFIAGQVLSSTEVQQSVLNDLRQVFPGTAEHTLNSLLSQIRHSTTSIGVLALIAALWLGSSFWGALDTAFTRIYGCQPRRWLEQKRFGLMMLGVVLLFMVATVAVPTVQSILDAGAAHLPFDLARVTDVVYAISLGISVVLLFTCLSVIYHRVPNRPVPWRRGMARSDRRDACDRRRRLRVPGVPHEHLDARPVRHDDRLHPDPADLVLPAGADHPRRRRRQCAGAERSRGSLLASRTWRPKRAQRLSFTADD